MHRSKLAAYVLVVLVTLASCACSPGQAGTDESPARPLSSASTFPASGTWIDLTHPFTRETIYWPTAREFEKSTVFEGYNDKGFYYTAYDFSAAEHGGTHVDAPVHFAEGRRTVDAIPVADLVGPAIVIRVVEQAARDRNYLISLEDVSAWESRNGPIPDGAILLFDTGSSRLWPNRRAYMGTERRGPDAVAELEFPGIHPDVARFLVAERNVKAVGLDTPSIDYGGSTHFETHRILYEHDIPGLENVANLDRIPDVGALVLALPMKIAGGSGGPARIVAWVPNAGGSGQ